MHVFVCHASEDKPRVRELCDRLRADGFEPWLDEERLLPGQDWEAELTAAVGASDAVIVCVSAASVGKAGYVQKELRRVLDAAEYQPEGRIFIIPVRLESCPLPTRLRQWQYADLFVEGGYERLRAALTARAEGRDGAAMLTPPSQAEMRSVKSPYIRRVTLAAAFLLVIAAVAAVATHFTNRTRGPELGSVSPPPVNPATKAEPVPAGMVRIPGGRFLMGRNGFSDPTASPAYEVPLPAFYLDRTPVTNARFYEFLRSSNKVSQWKAAGADDWPVTRVTWDEADAYCLAQGKRLPSESEWEFAARGSGGRLYPWGEAFDAAAVNYGESGIGHPEPVGTRTLNRSPFDVADMSGNVWQWSANDYRPYPGGTLAFAIPPGAKAIRGGSYQSDRLHVTAVTRNLELPSKRSPAIGFRCAK